MAGLDPNRFSGHGLYILDEPESALSPSNGMRLMCVLEKLVRDDSQTIVAMRSPMLMAMPGADVLLLTESGINRVDYRDTEHFMAMRSFLENSEKMLGYLFFIGLFPMTTRLDGFPMALSGVLDGVVANDDLGVVVMVPAALACQHVLLAVGRFAASNIRTADVADGVLLVAVNGLLLDPGGRILNPDLLVVRHPALCRGRVFLARSVIAWIRGSRLLGAAALITLGGSGRRRGFCGVSRWCVRGVVGRLGGAVIRRIALLFVV